MSADNVGNIMMSVYNVGSCDAALRLIKLCTNMIKVSENTRTARTLCNKKDAFGVKHDTENEQSRAELSDTVLKTVSNVDEVTLDGRLFHTHKSATRND